MARRKRRKYVVVSSPWDEDEGLPWAYHADGLKAWVWETFLEGYKDDEPLPSVGEALDILESNGYEVVIR